MFFEFIVLVLVVLYKIIKLQFKTKGGGVQHELIRNDIQC